MVSNNKRGSPGARASIRFSTVCPSVAYITKQVGVAAIQASLVRVSGVQSDVSSDLGWCKGNNSEVPYCVVPDVVLGVGDAAELGVELVVPHVLELLDAPVRGVELLVGSHEVCSLGHDECSCSSCSGHS